MSRTVLPSDRNSGSCSDFFFRGLVHGSPLFISLADSEDGRAIRSITRLFELHDWGNPKVRQRSKVPPLARERHKSAFPPHPQTARAGLRKGGLLVLWKEEARRIWWVAGP